jgi:hypothetical protein
MTVKPTEGELLSPVEPWADRVISAYASDGRFVIRCPAREHLFRLFLGSSAVEHSTVNRMVAGSNPARGAILQLSGFSPGFDRPGFDCFENDSRFAERQPFYWEDQRAACAVRSGASARQRRAVSISVSVAP